MVLDPSPPPLIMWARGSFGLKPSPRRALNERVRTEGSTPVIKPGTQVSTHFCSMAGQTHTYLKHFLLRCSLADLVKNVVVALTLRLMNHTGLFQQIRLDFCACITHMQIRTHTNPHIHINVCIYGNIYVHAYMHMYIHMSTYVDTTPQHTLRKLHVHDILVYQLAFQIHANTHTCNGSLTIKVNINPLSETRGVVVSQRLGISKSLQYCTRQRDHTHIHTHTYTRHDLGA